MIKQAILITAYKNYHHLGELIASFDHNFELYIHIDKKSKISEQELYKFRANNNVKLISQKYRVNWGGFNHLKCILYLVEQALKNSENQYFHLITGHDFPIKKIDDFINYFNNNNQVEHINYFDIPRKDWADNGGIDRIVYFNLYDIFNAKNINQNRLINRIVKLQKIIGFKRSISSIMPKIYGGSTYWSLSRACIEHVLDFTKQNKYVLNRFKYTLCPEEFYFQTIIINSGFAGNVINNNLRYIDWNYRNGNRPSVLDDSDYENILNSNAFFARKFEYPISLVLLKKIKKLIN